MNLLSLGFPADVGELTNRRFKRWGELGYILGVFTRLAGLKHLAFPHRCEGSSEWDRRPCLFLSFSNSKFTGGKMMIAPKADATDGLIEYVRWSPVGPCCGFSVFFRDCSPARTSIIPLRVALRSREEWNSISISR